MINFRLILKGAAMGCADLIPGVSGGTIALVTGIYEELIGSIKSLDIKALKLISKWRVREFWEHINGAFLIQVFLGVAISLFTLSALFSYLLENHPIPVWSFFFGLILVSAFYVFPRDRTLVDYVFGLIGLIIAYAITSLSPASSPDQLWFVFVSGAIAICAMILPGISGSFILILLAKYEFILNAVKSFDLKIIVIFGLGCVVGLISFSKFIHWLLQKHKSATMAALAGFMLGSLNKIWPWKRIDDEHSFVNLSPGAYTDITGYPSQIFLAITMCVIGGVVILLLEYSGRTKE